MEVSASTWRLAMTGGAKVREVAVAAWDRPGFEHALDDGKRALGMAQDARVAACYEAGREGFSIHRYLESLGVESLVMDPSSIEVPRRGRRVKTDRLDAKRLLVLLRRHLVFGETTAWRAVRPPTREAEDRVRLDREHARLQKERKGHLGRVRALLALHGATLAGGMRAFDPETARDWSGAALPANCRRELAREVERLALVDAHLAEVARTRREKIASGQTQADVDAAKLMRLRGLGWVNAETLAAGFFSRRDFHNRREVGSAAGLTGSAYDSGSIRREQGISKRGPRRVRTQVVETAWLWVKWQPESELSRWYQERFGGGGPRTRRIGIVALSRKLLVALWKYLRQDIVPAGAILRDEDQTPPRAAVKCAATAG
jgi:transposase